MPDNCNLDNRDLDVLLDKALASYTAAEPDPSMRARIMTHAAEAAPHPKRLWLFAPAAACAAALVIAFLLHSSTPASRPEPSTAASAANTSASPPAPMRAVPQQAIHPHPALAARRSEPPAVMRNASFPSPTPLTAEENILLKFATEHPDQARQVLTAPAARPIETAPLAIASIHIAPLSETEQTQHWQ